MSVPDHSKRYDSEPDTVLVERCLAHDRVAWGAFVERFSRLIYGVVYGALKRQGLPADGDSVDDLFHRVFLALYDNDYKKLRQWSRRCSVASWVRLVAGSVVVDALRQRRPAVSLDGELGRGGPTARMLVDAAAGPLAMLERAQKIRAVRAALKRLSSGDRGLLTRLFVEGASAEVVAADLGIRPGALYTRKNRALKRLRDVLAPDIETLL